MSAAPETIQRENLDRLQSELSTRRSTVLFAHAGVSAVIAFILLCSAAKLAWDVRNTYVFALIVCVLALLVTVYSVIRGLDGRKVLAVERQRYAEMMALRRELKLDDPSALLPKA